MPKLAIRIYFIKRFVILQDGIYYKIGIKIRNLYQIHDCSTCESNPRPKKKYLQLNIIYKLDGHPVKANYLC